MKHRFPRKIQWRMLLSLGLIVLSLVMVACSTPASVTTISTPVTNIPTTATTTPVTSTTTPTITPKTQPTITTVAPEKTALTVVNGTTSKTYTMEQLKAMTAMTGWGSTKNKAGTISTPVSCVGVVLSDLINHTGGMISTQFVKITASDGYTKTLTALQVYQGAFAVVDANGNTTTPSTVPVAALVYSTNGNVLGGTTGPIELGILTDKSQASESSLWVKMVIKVEVLSATTLNISAAASLTDALKELNTLYSTQNPNITITPNFASSGTLQTQIQNGAPADVFISAAATQMDNLQKGGLLIDDTRKNLLNNKIVLIVPIDSTLGLTSFSDLATDKVKKIAIGDPKSVPAGTYAQQAFDELGITAQLQPKLVLGSDVRQVLTYVESGNVDAGIVYSTDALTSTKVKVVGSAPADINAKVVYPVAVIKASNDADAAKAYLDFLFSAQAKAVFEKYGFTSLAK